MDGNYLNVYLEPFVTVMVIKIIILAAIIFTYYLGRLNTPDGSHTITLFGISFGVAFVTFFIFMAGKMIALEWCRINDRDVKLVFFEKILVPAAAVSYPIHAVLIFYVTKGGAIIFNSFSYVLLLILFVLLMDVGAKARSMILDQYPNLMAKERKLFSKYPPKTVGDMSFVLLLYSLMILIPFIYSLRHS